MSNQHLKLPGGALNRSKICFEGCCKHLLPPDFSRLALVTGKGRLEGTTWRCRPASPQKNAVATQQAPTTFLPWKGGIQSSVAPLASPVCFMTLWPGCPGTLKPPLHCSGRKDQVCARCRGAGNHLTRASATSTVKPCAHELGPPRDAVTQEHSLKWLLDHLSLFPTCLSTFSLLQDENDNPPTFSKPSYVITVLEDIMAGTSPSPTPPLGSQRVFHSHSGVGDPFGGGEVSAVGALCGRAAEGTPQLGDLECGSTGQFWLIPVLISASPKEPQCCSSMPRTWTSPGSMGRSQSSTPWKAPRIFGSMLAQVSLWTCSALFLSVPSLTPTLPSSPPVSLLRSPTV